MRYTDEPWLFARAMGAIVATIWYLVLVILPGLDNYSFLDDAGWLFGPVAYPVTMLFAIGYYFSSEPVSGYKKVLLEMFFEIAILVGTLLGVAKIRGILPRELSLVLYAQALLIVFVSMAIVVFSRCTYYVASRYIRGTYKASGTDHDR